MTMLRRGLFLVTLAGLCFIAVLSACAVGASRGHGNETAAPELAQAAQDQGKGVTASEVATGRQDQGTVGAVPQAVFAERLYDAGTVQASDGITHTFLVKNVGKADLRIEKVKPG